MVQKYISLSFTNTTTWLAQLEDVHNRIAINSWSFYAGTYHVRIQTLWKLICPNMCNQLPRTEYTWWHCHQGSSARKTVEKPGPAAPTGLKNSTSIYKGVSTSCTHPLLYVLLCKVNGENSLFRESYYLKGWFNSSKIIYQGGAYQGRWFAHVRSKIIVQTTSKSDTTVTINQWEPKSAECVWFWLWERAGIGREGSWRVRKCKCHDKERQISWWRCQDQQNNANLKKLIQTETERDW